MNAGSASDTGSIKNGLQSVFPTKLSKMPLAAESNMMKAHIRLSHGEARENVSELMIKKRDYVVSPHPAPFRERVGISEEIT